MKNSKYSSSDRMKKCPDAMLNALPPSGRLSVAAFVACVAFAAAMLILPAVHGQKEVSPATTADEPALFEGPPLSIAFSSQRDLNDEIYVMDADGGYQTNVSQNAASDITPDISPNGQLIAFASNRVTSENPEGDYEIFIMTARGDVLQQVTHNTTRDSWPRWAPNGRTIAYENQASSTAATSWEIYTYDLGAEDAVRLTTNTVLDRFPEWSPNGKFLVIRRASDLFLIDAEGSDVAQLTYDVPPAGSGFPAAPNPDQMGSFSPDGKQIAWMSLRNGYPSVFVLDIDRPEIQIELTPKPASEPTAGFVSRAPAWSRNGKFIYFTRKASTTVGEDIWKMEADGSDPVFLTNATGNDAEPGVR